jgi:hypothetical protein
VAAVAAVDLSVIVWFVVAVALCGAVLFRIVGV